MEEYIACKKCGDEVPLKYSEKELCLQCAEVANAL